MSEWLELQTLDDLLNAPVGTVLWDKENNFAYTKTRRQGLPWDKQPWPFGRAASEGVADSLPLKVFRWGAA